MEMITWEDFDKVEMRVGRVVGIEEFPAARNPSYLLTLDFGTDLGLKQSSVAIRHLYTKEELAGRLLVAVTNFPAKQVANRMSHVLVLAGVNPDGTMRLLQPDGEVELGARVR